MWRRRDTVFKWMRWSNPIHERILILFRDNLSPFWLNILSLHTDKNFVVLLIRRRLVFLGLFPSLFFFFPSAICSEETSWLHLVTQVLFEIISRAGARSSPRGLIDSAHLRLAPWRGRQRTGIFMASRSSPCAC